MIRIRPDLSVLEIYDQSLKLTRYTIGNYRYRGRCSHLVLLQIWRSYRYYFSCSGQKTEIRWYFFDFACTILDKM